jgi:hypothetical protein
MFSSVRKDSAAHVSLSSSSLVKQPGAREPQWSRSPCALRHTQSLFGDFNLPRRLCARQLAGWRTLIIVRSLKARKSAEALKAEAPPRSMAGL